VWNERAAAAAPLALPSLPESWPNRYERLATDHGLHTQSFNAAFALVGRLWADMFPTQET
jgi:hypothetical protein